MLWLFCIIKTGNYLSSVSFLSVSVFAPTNNFFLHDVGCSFFITDVLVFVVRRQEVSVFVFFVLLFNFFERNGCGCDHH